MCVHATTCPTDLKLSQLLHKLLLLLAVAEWRDDVEEDLQQVKTLSRYTGQGKNGRDAAGKINITRSEHRHHWKVSVFAYCKGFKTEKVHHSSRTLVTERTAVLL